MTAAILLVVAVAGTMRDGDLLFDHVDKPQRDLTAPLAERNESEAA